MILGEFFKVLIWSLLAGVVCSVHFDNFSEKSVIFVLASVTTALLLQYSKLVSIIYEADDLIKKENDNDTTGRCDK